MNRQEIKYIIYSAIFALIWFILALPFLVKHFDGNNPMFQFFVFNVGLYIFFFIFLKSLTTSTRSNLITTIGLLSLFLALDCWLPEYHVNLQGQLIEGGTLGVSTTDYFAGYLAINYLHLNGIFVYLFAYFLFPIILLIIAERVLPNFVRHV